MTTVIIPTVGTGSRMNPFTTDLNKALLPYKNKPILAHIIDQFPKDSKFIIPVGHLSEQIRDFCHLAYADRDIIIVPILDWLSNASGTSTTLKKCAFINEPFWYVPCDTYFNEPVSATEDCYFIKHVDPSLSTLYTMFDLDQDRRIKETRFKEQLGSNWWAAFTGLMYIADFESFFWRLEHSLSSEFVYSIIKGSKTTELKSWMDFGNPESYKEALANTQKFDFTKKNEMTYICNNRVVKWWLDETIAEKKIDRIAPASGVYPDNCTRSGNWIGYDLFKGTTMYEHNDPGSFTLLLEWLDKTIWQPVFTNIENDCMGFYREKTLARIEAFKEKYPDRPKATKVDGVPINESLIEQIDWNFLAKKSAAGMMHGDLQFDNIIVNSGMEFKLIDWRHEFGDLVYFGDIYYDLAKLYGGFLVDYSKIKNGELGITRCENEVTLKIPQISNKTIYINELLSFARDKGYNMKKIELLVPIIYLNMAPLHTAPFDQALWYLGLKLLHEALLQPE